MFRFRMIGAAYLVLLILGGVTVDAADDVAVVEVVEVVVGGEMERPGGFAGIGYHVFYPLHVKQLTPDVEAVLHERWMDLRPSFARVTHQWDWDVEVAVRQMEMMKQTGTQIYLTTWNPKDLETAAERESYSREVAEMLEDLVVKRKLDNIKWYCMTNELSLPGTWGAMNKDLPKFEDYHRRIDKALKQRKVPVKLLATDASPTWQWNSIEWAVENMDDVTGVYGGHHYFNKREPEGREAYGWFKQTVGQYAGMAHAKGKPFIIGEFGPKQHRGERYGFKRWDGCAYFDTEQESMAALQAAEIVMAGINGGASGMGYWTFADFPDDYVAEKRYANKWGVFRWDERFTKRPVYFSVGLMTRFFRGPAKVYEVTAGENVWGTAISDGQTGLYRVAVVNRRDEAVRVKVNVDGRPGGAEGGGGDNWDGYVFDTKKTDAYCREKKLLNDNNRVEFGDEVSVLLPGQSLVVLVER